MNNFIDYDSLSENQRENILAYFYLLRDEFKEIRELIKALIDYKPFELDVCHATPIQKALNIAVVISYSRNFTNSYGFKFQKRINNEIIASFLKSENDLHDKVKDTRNEEFAHSDSNAHDIKFNEYIDVNYSSRVVRQLLDKNQLSMLLEMVSKIQSNIKIHLDEFK